jgi:hypothetical protein
MQVDNRSNYNGSQRLRGASITVTYIIENEEHWRILS